MVISMTRWVGKVAVVTGASSGIGAAIAESLVKEGLIVVGLARRKELVEKLAKKLEGKPGKLHAFKTDVTVESDILTAFKWVKDTLGPIHVLVNNAGIARALPLLEAPTDIYKLVLDTNVLGLCIATREAVKNMTENKVDGHIIHMNSILGHHIPGLPCVNVYGAAKHAVTALTETLRQELNTKGSKIKITSVSPGIVETEIFEASGSPSPKEMGMPMLKSEDIADAVTYILATPPHVQIHELTIKPVNEPF